MLIKNLTIVLLVFIVWNLLLKNNVLLSENKNYQILRSGINEFVPYRDTTYQLYYIYKIKKVKNGFLILLRKEIDGKDLFLNLVSSETDKKCSAKIKVGQFYKLKIFAYYQVDKYLNHYNFEITLNGKQIIVKPNKWRANVYTSPNLKGLYYCEN